MVLRLKRRDRARLDAFLGPRTARLYGGQFPEHGDLNGPTEVFVNGPSVNDCYKFCRRLGDQLGIDNLHPHRFRHTVARDLIQAGASPSVVQKALGHKSGTMALLYSEALDTEAMDAMAQVRGG